MYVLVSPALAPPGAPLTTTHRVISYTYDALYRLTDAEYSTGEFYQYTYDPVGNRLSLTTGGGVVNYAYDAANRLASVNGQAYTWDANGNLLNDGLRSYSYDHANRLTSVTSGTVTTQFSYDGLGNRTETTVDGVTTRYALDVAGGLPEVIVATTGGASTQYLQVGGQILAQYDSGTWAYVLPDHLGSVRAETDAVGQVVVVRHFDPFGVPLQADGGSPFGYTGEWWESQAELLYLRARYYDAGVGRFTQRDPWRGNIQQPQTVFGTYVYVGNNPVNYADPTGMWRWWATPSIYHFLIEHWYEEVPFLNPIKQLEYPIPGTFFRRPDMFNAGTGDVYEIEPWYKLSSGAAQVTGYVRDLSTAAGLKKLTGTYFGVPYNWNFIPFHTGTGVDWPGKFRMPDPRFPYLDIVADYYSDGVVLYWHEPNAWALVAVSAFGFLVVPNKRLFKPRNWAPGQLAPQPAYAVVSCGQVVLVLAGGAAIALALVDNLAGVPDDAILVPVGLLLISWGLNQAVLVPVQEVGEPYVD